jgi:hypothetical protein
MIKDIKDLAAHLGAVRDTTESIGIRVYKDTYCGCPAGVEDGYFWVTGYCEGSDQEHEVYKVEFPCKSEDIDKAICQADEDGKNTWDETHGCSKCWSEGQCNAWGEYFSPGEIGGPINPDCKTCGGDGVVF